MGSSFPWRRVGVLAAVWGVLGGGALIVSACYGRNCEGAQFRYGIDAGQGEMLDENWWESSPQNSQWLLFPRQHSYVFTLPLGGRTPAGVWPYVSAQPNGNVDGNHTLGSGNLTEIASAAPNQVVIINDTCSDYYLRVLVWAPPFGTSDGGTVPAPTTVDPVLDAAAGDAASDATVP